MKENAIRASTAVVAFSLVCLVAPPPRAGSAPASADPLEAVVAAPKNHRVLYEDAHVRLLEVTVEPGETENMHVHRYASVFAYDAAQPKLRNRFANGKTVEYGRNFEGGDRMLAATDLPAPVRNAMTRRNADLPAALSIGWPVAMPLGPDKSGPHQITNLDTFPHHFYRLEFKRIEGNDIMKRTSY
jgi:hypothetical protein